MNKILWGSLVSLAFSCGLVACGDSASGNGPQDPDTSSSSVVVPFGSSSSAGVLGSSSSAGSSSAGTASSSSSAAVPSSSSNAALGGNTQTCAYSSTSNTLTCSEKTYQTVTIGTQIWMAENLNVGTMVLGMASTADQSNNTVIEKYCYDDNAAACATDGGLYQWAEAMALPSTCNRASCTVQISSGHHQGICPSGWHIPKTAEWNLLATMLGGSSVAGKTMKLNSAGNTDWNSSTYNDGNSSGFSALPVGGREYGGAFFDRGGSANFWEASENSASVANYRNLYNGYADLFASNVDKSFGLSVRCLRD
jgi:uncharacterized protein (TIGR02145 family)